MPSAGRLRSSAKSFERSGRGAAPVISMGLLNANEFLDRTGRRFWGADYANFVDNLGEALETSTRGFRGRIAGRTPKASGNLRKSAFSYIARGDENITRSGGGRINIVARRRPRGQSGSGLERLTQDMAKPLFRENIFIQAGVQAYDGGRPKLQQMLSVEFGNRNVKASNANRNVYPQIVRVVRNKTRANINKYLGGIRRASGRSTNAPLSNSQHRTLIRQNQRIKSNAQRYAANKARFAASSRPRTRRFPSDIYRGPSGASRRTR